MSDPLVCVTVTGETIDELRRARDAAADADLVELRLDSVRQGPLDVAGALQNRRTPSIVTCRPVWEGGRFTGGEDERRAILESAIRLGAEFVDVEAAAPFAGDLIKSRSGRAEIVLSAHWHDQPPPDLTARYASMRASGAAVVKLAIQVDRLEQTLPLFDLASTAMTDGGEHVFIGMGPAGVSSRVLAGRLGNRWTYAGDGVAPGQFPAGRLLREYRFRRIRPDAALYGVVGNPVLHSLSPVMHNAGFAACGLNGVYLPLEARDASDFVRFARQTRLRGASITAPFKVALMDAMDDVDALSQRVGAINTLIVRDGRWIGANSDVEGLLAPLAGRIHLKGVRASILGAGGAARAAAVALSDQGAAVTICARRPDAAQPIATLVRGSVGEFPPRPSSWDVLVNATPVGSHADSGNPIEDAELDGEIVFDLVYSPAETPLMHAASEAGCLVIGGLEMLVAQAERQFEMWTGQRPPAGLFHAAATQDR